MKVLVIASAKGGSGKTTLARNLCAAVAESGVDVGAVDTDDQITLSKWWAKRDERKGENLPRIALYQASIHEAVDGIDELNHDIVVVDTPPVVDRDGSLSKLIDKADYVLIPVRPTDDDWVSVQVVHELAVRAGKPFGYVINQATARASLVETCKRVLLDRGGAVCPFVIGVRQDYPIAGMTGLGVTEVKGMKQASEDITVVTSFLRLQMDGFR